MHLLKICERNLLDSEASAIDPKPAQTAFSGEDATRSRDLARRVQGSTRRQYFSAQTSNLFLSESALIVLLTMPGPGNIKKMKKAQNKKDKRTKGRSSLSAVDTPSSNDSSFDTSNEASLESADTAEHAPDAPIPTLRPPSPPESPKPSSILSHLENDVDTPSSHESPLPSTPPEEEDDPTLTFLKKPMMIHDPGNGPRVRDAPAFISSSFAQPPCMDDPLCAEFAQQEVLQMLRTVLPEETALVRHYKHEVMFVGRRKLIGS